MCLLTVDGNLRVINSGRFYKQFKEELLAQGNGISYSFCYAFKKALKENKELDYHKTWMDMRDTLIGLNSLE